MCNGEIIPKDSFKDECGVFGIYGDQDPGISRLTYYGLYALQHRGQESCGIAVSTGKNIEFHKGMGLVAEVFSDEILETLQGGISCGHVRYSTSGQSNISNAQPLVVKYWNGNLALAHNGNLVNAEELRKELEREGTIFQTSVDSEIIANLISRLDQGNIVEAIKKAMKIVKGAYALVLATRTQLIGIRDPNGIRPLSLGKKGNSLIFSSESCAFNTIGAQLLRDVEPGEIVVVDEDGLQSYFVDLPRKDKLCIFEYIYFARSDSNIRGKNIYMARRRAGEILFSEHPAKADVVISVPDSGTSAAMGYAQAAGIPFAEGLVKNRYVGRTFIQPKQSMRKIGVALKLNVLENIVRGKRVVLVDDSIVRGTTITELVEKLRIAGVSEVHLRVSSPPVTYPCYFGIDTPSKKELVGANLSINEIQKKLGVDSIGYLSLQGLIEAIGKEDNYCEACFSGSYPIDIPKERSKMAFAKEDFHVEI
ncbi:MAG: amidophosphoribosyltransferase [Kosmotoga sp.]|uniref:amidophosphoribosyltransferase n=1 Tax=Kosmotoga sp. TaxID=1955248 RepID=UPI0025C089E0|nr:amidophosphoribosyltransferase [Kosmotoga sp.]MCD6159721.1 amidophosphoribosyltransferase [Kosmotoga sp.]